MRRWLFLLVACLVAGAAPVAAQGVPLYPAGMQFFDNTTGTPLAAGLLYTCVVGSACPGTTQTTWSDVALGSANSNPITLTANGRLPNAVYTSGATYKLLLQSSAAVTEFTQDNVPSPAGYNISTLTGTTIPFQTQTVLTLSSNTVTPTRNIHGLDTSGGAQNLNTINTSGVTAPIVLYLYGNNPGANPVTVTSAGNIVLASGNFTLSSSAYWLALVLRGTTWYELGRTIAAPPIPGTSGGVPYYNSTTTLASSALLTQNGVLYGGGAGAAPAATAAGTNDQFFVARTGLSPTFTQGAFFGAALRLLTAGTGSTTSAAASTVAVVSIGGTYTLTAKDRIIVEVTAISVTQPTASLVIRNATDGVTLTAIHAGGPGAGETVHATIYLAQSQASATSIVAREDGRGTAVGDLGKMSVNAVATNWTGLWDLDLRQGGVTAGGTLQWSWAVYVELGQ